MKQKILLLLSNLRARLKRNPGPCVHTPWPPKYTIAVSDLQNMLVKLDYERIRRAMMLFDIRWLDDQGNVFTPNEDQLRAHAGKMLVQTFNVGRVYGEIENRDRGFHVMYRSLENGNEVMRIRYVLTEAASV